MSKQITEVELLQQKVVNRAKNNMPSITEVMGQIENEDKFLTDALVNTNELKFGTDRIGDRERLLMSYGKTEAGLNKYTTKQVANRFGIPTPYINALMETDWGRNLAVKLLNEHARKSDVQRVLVRNINDTVRGVLSDSYKRINSMMVFMAFLQAANAKHATLYNAAIDDTKSFIEVIQPEVVEIETPKNGTVHIVFGAELRNSDFGDGRLNLRTFYLNVACLNGQIGTKFLNEVHRGGRLPENLVLSQETYTKESEAQASVCTDSMNHLFDPANMRGEVERIQRASDTPMDYVEGVKALKRTKHYSENELSILTAKLMAKNPDDGIQGANTKWGFVQGITSLANTYTTTRRNELIEYASDMMQ